MGKQDLAVAIIADDLSGGADCGVSFSHAGLDVAIQLDRTAEAPHWAQAAVVPTDSRDQEADEARAAVAETVTSLAMRHPAMWYKKIDSTLRGHLALELAVTIRGVRPDLTVVAPAFPAHGRTVVGGRGFLRGIPLERTETWRAQGMRGTADLPAMLRAGGLRVRSLHLDDIRTGRAAERLRDVVGETDIVVCDAETEDDLAAVAAGGQGTGLKVLWTGSAGLAQHLAGLRVARPGNNRPAHDGSGRTGNDGPGNDGSGNGNLKGIAPVTTPVAVVVGSAAGAAVAQLRHLETLPGIRVVRVHPAAILDSASGRQAAEIAANDLAAADGAIGAALADGQDVALGLVPPDSPGGVVLDATASRVVSRALGKLIGSRSGQLGGFALTGGDTALAVLAACGVTALRPVSEVATGVPVCVASPDGRPVITKAGAFGDERILAHAVGVLHGRQVPRAAGVSTLDTQERNSSRAQI
jgi:D-threonate/D-erythronate kinase